MLSLLLMATCMTASGGQQSDMTPRRYEPTWESLATYIIPEWFRDAKFGIFIHWGPYSVPAFGDAWYARFMYDENYPMYKHHQENWGDQRVFGYKDFIPLFKAEKWDPDAWARLFKEAGARYVVPCAEHHDAFAMYDSAYTRWNAVAMGPKRDVIGELSNAVRKQGMRFGVSSHYAFNWYYFIKKEGFDTADPQYADLYGTRQGENWSSGEELIHHWWDPNDHASQEFINGIDFRIVSPLRAAIP